MPAMCAMQDENELVDCRECHKISVTESTYFASVNSGSDGNLPAKLGNTIFSQNPGYGRANKTFLPVYFLYYYLN